VPVNTTLPSPSDLDCPPAFQETPKVSARTNEGNLKLTSVEELMPRIHAWLLFAAPRQRVAQLVESQINQSPPLQFSTVDKAKLTFCSYETCANFLLVRLS
jgi:hypothetical protein